MLAMGSPEEQQAVDDLVELLDLEDIEVNVFRGRSPDIDQQRVFGGQVAGQALVAAARTVDDMSGSRRKITGDFYGRGAGIVCRARGEADKLHSLA